MSNVFKNTIRTFKSDITGEEKDYKVNNAVWIYLNELFEMTQNSFDEAIVEDQNVAMSKFTTAVLKANGLDVSYEEVMENTDPVAVIKFYNDFFDIAFKAPISEQKEKAEKLRKIKK